MIFKHTFREPGMWRGWLPNGQSVEVSWDRRGWEFGGGVHIHGNDADLGDRMLFLKIWRLTIVFPLGIVHHPWGPMEAPQWSAYGSSEFGLTFRWGSRYQSYSWPWAVHSLAYEEQLEGGSWRDVISRSSDEGGKKAPHSEVYPYTYTLRSGEVQHRLATVTRRRHVLCRKAFKRFGRPQWMKESINVEFDDEVGERTGSWKGGVIGCNYDLRSGESMERALRRMERERRFT